MTTAITPVTPDYTSDSGSQYPTNIDQGLASAQILANQFQPHEAGTPDMTVLIDGGSLWISGTYTTKTQQTTSTITAPSTNPRIDLVVIDLDTGLYSVITGTEAASPVPPAYDGNHYPVCEIALATSTTQIVNSLITDIRPSINGYAPDVSGYVKGTTEYLEGDAGADDTSFDVDGVISTAWESVGPTGSGATNIFTALDNVPIGAKWVEVIIFNTVTSNTGAALSQALLGRKTGSSAGVSPYTYKSFASISASGSTFTSSGNAVVVRIPIDTNRRFDLYVSEDGTSRNVNMHLTGWGI